MILLSSIRTNLALCSLCALWLTSVTAQQNQETILVSLIDRPVGKETTTSTTIDGKTAYSSEQLWLQAGFR